MKIKNLLRRHFGSPEQRAKAWEDFAIHLQRSGWLRSDKAYSRAYSIRLKHGLISNPKDENEVIFQSNHFKLVLPRRPFIDRRDGGHVMIVPVMEVLDRMHFSEEQAGEYMPFCMAVGKAFQETMNESGIAVERLNWMDMGNWSLLGPKPPVFHVHIFGRAKGSRFQIHGEFNQIPPKGSKHYEMIDHISDVEIAKLKERVSKYFAIFCAGVPAQGT
jgi:diadenosine tetraphosphate (Ap4A) HIT family hydrolase